jgi:putative heme-binding domain-containing protein
LEEDDDALRREALRSLRPRLRDDAALRRKVRNRLRDERYAHALALAAGQTLPPKEPRDHAAGGDPEAGRRLYFHPNGPACFKCHTVAGRGGEVGPDLSVIARTMSREKLAESILQPSREVSPQFTNWLFLTDSGRQLSGMVLSEDADIVRIGTAEGRVLELEVERIERRRPQRISVMPAGLADQMTAREFRDLLAYLETLR